MIIFSTMFYVKKELTKEKFSELAMEWINQSPHYGFDELKWSGEGVFDACSEKQTFSAICSSDGSMLAIRLENIDDNNVIWTNDFVLEEQESRNLLVVRLAREAMDKRTNIGSYYNRPRLMKKILEKGYGDIDNGLMIIDKPIIISEENIDIVKDVINGSANYLLPIVYVTRSFWGNELPLDVNALAKDLAGTAHVLVESDTTITTKLKEKTGGKNPFNGAVHIYFTNTNGTRLLLEDWSDANTFRYKVVNSVCRRLSLLKLEDKYTWSTIRYRRLLEQYREGQKESSELEKTCEEILQMKEKESSQLIEELQNELLDLRAKVQNYEYALQNKQSSQIYKIGLECEEYEFYEGEIKDMILDIISEEKKKMEGDSNQQAWRKYHVLESILKTNKRIGNGAELAKELKEILSRIDRVDAKDRRRLREIGFVIKEDAHNKIYFHDDPRYYITLGKTPSDYHAGSNAASIAINTIVCASRKEY